MWPGGCALEPSDSAGCVAGGGGGGGGGALPLRGTVPVPFKPIFFDLAYSLGVEYPLEALGALAGVTREGGGGGGGEAAPGSPGVGGTILSWLGVKQAQQ